MSDRITQPAAPAGQYEPPSMKVLGPVGALTLDQLKTFGTGDHIMLQIPGQQDPVGLMNASG